MERSIGELDAAYRAEHPDQAQKTSSRQTLALKSYNNGYEFGFAAGQENERVRQEGYVKEDRSIKFWKISAIFLTGVIIGMVLAGIS